MNRNDFHNKLHSSKGMMFIVTGLTALVEEEGYTPHEALDIAKTAGQECYFALNEIHKEAKVGAINEQLWFIFRLFLSGSKSN
ncbi:hypothetical protein [Lysinibacillus sp. NPDC092081]|uniref:hypothetical protein n=1 Tax=Lysinibacillus sp. NPDC092081 TaxID=3364131 RepID=UPI00381F5100